MIYFVLVKCTLLYSYHERDCNYRLANNVHNVPVRKQSRSDFMGKVSEVRIIHYPVKG